MSFEPRLHFSRIIGGLVLGLALALGFSGRANVYATNIKLNGGITNLTLPSGQSVEISYILNEPASLGAAVLIASGSNVVRTISIPAASPGALRGTNVVEWDGKNDQSSSVPAGTYSVRVTAASSGYTNWTQTTLDSDPNQSVYDGRGIAVDLNPMSAYYGRIFVANSADGGSPDTAPGILKFNADGSAAEEGVLSAGSDGHDWQGQELSPWNLTVSSDDYVYVDDRVNGGEVYRWDPTISSNALLYVLRQDNQPSGAILSGPAVTGAGTNTLIWMADMASSNGVVEWALTTNLTCATNDTGLSVVGLGGDLVLPPYAVAIDGQGNIYTIQNITDESNPTPRVFRFPAYDPSTNGGVAETNADWAIGGNDDNYGGASGIAVDSIGTYVAVAFQGTQFGGTLATNGSTRIFYATNGAWVADLDLGIPVDGDASHQDTACAWDAVGNVYYIDNWSGHWRAFSPPGTNQATTVALANVQVMTPSVIQITSITVSGGITTLRFSAGTNDTASAFTLVSAASPSGPYAAANGADISNVGPGIFQATVPATGPEQFYRVHR